MQGNTPVLLCKDTRITRRNLCLISNKNFKQLFLKVLALRALFCHCQESGRKPSSTIFLPTPKHILTNIKTFKKQKQKKIRCAACFSALALFLLLLIPEHEMRRLVLMANDVNSFTVRHHQYQTINLEKIGISKRVIPVFVKTETQEFASEPIWITRRNMCLISNKNSNNTSCIAHSIPV